VLDVELITLEKSMTLTNSSAHRTTLAAAKQIIIDIDFPINLVAAKCTVDRSFLGLLFRSDLSARKGKSVHRTGTRKEKGSSVMEGGCCVSVDAKSLSNPSKKTE
jgi:hypothetical protein